MTSSGFEDPNEIMFREVHPAWVRDGRITSQAFKPTATDEDKVSVYRSSLITAEGAFLYHTEVCKMSSTGTWGVTVAECTGEDVPVLPDPVESPPERVQAAHCVLDFTTVGSRKQVEGKASKLSRAATARGCLFEP